eukprot:12425304-Karenia_brevis.AAC.1
MAVESKPFEIGCGTKQGDPLSPPLFNAVLEEVLKKCKIGWASKGLGVRVDNEEHAFLQNLRFADDILLLGSSLKQVAEMLSDLACIAAEVGLQIHMGKTKILSALAPEEGDEINLNGKTVEILPPSKAVTYLGRCVCMSSFHEAEIDNRISKAWGKFAAYKRELCCRHYPICERMKLFNS